ncbi:multidrug effflux MFS transporter [Breoghania sp.]|uniref:multidrug effflux MFS transporter n=1 Tax=Breoghania sp. TaxID=2065378 RepID=UPI0029CA77D0|nr:multidrug effflux MFS transporter [Breoghania sp.]
MTIISSERGRTRPSGNRNILIFATSLAIISMIGIDIYIPAFDVMQSDFLTSEAMIGLSMPAYFAGTFATQLFYGPISDLVGRKPVLLSGLVIFLLGTLGCVFAGSVELFLVARFVQAFGVCATAVLWQPIVTDTHAGDEAKVKAVFGFVMSFIGISPALAPLLGGWLTETFGWRSVFVFLLAFGGCVLLFASVAFQETLDVGRKRKMSSRGVFSALGDLATTPVFYIYALAVGLTVGAYMSYLTIAPFSLAKLGYSPLEIGIHFIPLAMLFGLGGAVHKIAGARLSEVNLLRLASLLMLCAGIGFYVNLNSGAQAGLFDYLVPFGVLTFTFGIIIPTGSAMAIQHFHRISGTCSSGMNFTTSVAAFVSTLVASLYYGAYQHNAMLYVIIVNAGAVLVLLLMLRSDRERSGTVAQEKA